MANKGGDVIENKSERLIIVISGPSGAGKDSVVRGLLEKDRQLSFVVTTNSRPKRVSEIEGKDYFFVSRHKFVAMIENGEFVEYATVYGDYKGVTKTSINNALESNNDIVIRVDVQGAEQLKKLYKNVLLIYIKPTAEEQLLGQLKGRKTDSIQTINNRVGVASEEESKIDLFDYVVVNETNNLSGTIDQIIQIIINNRSNS